MGRISKVKREMANSNVGLPAGRPKSLSKRDKRTICRIADSNGVDNAETITRIASNDYDIRVSTQTIRRALKEAGYRSVKKVKKPKLTAKQKRDRLDFAITHRDWTPEDWEQVVFSDETKVNRISSDGLYWTWKHNERTPDSKLEKPAVKHGGGRIMVWSCFTRKGVGYCTLIEGNMDQKLYKDILRDDLVETLRYYKLRKSEIIFQHDNDPKHTAKSVQNWLAKKFTVLKWPSNSPDLNPIEHLWNQVKRKLQDYETIPTSCKELWERFQLEWNRIPVERCQALYESMPKRMEAVIAAKGGATKY